MGLFNKLFKHVTAAANNIAKNAASDAKKATQSIGADLNKAAQGVKTDVSKVAGDVANLAKKAGSAIVDASIFIPMLPLKPGMKAAIKVAKYPDANPPDDNTALAKEFYDKVILNEQFEGLEHFARARGVSIHKAPVMRSSPTRINSKAFSGGGSRQSSGSAAPGASLSAAPNIQPSTPASPGAGSSPSGGGSFSITPINSGQAANATAGPQAQASAIGYTGQQPPAPGQSGFNPALYAQWLAQQALANQGGGGGGSDGGSDDGSGWEGDDGSEDSGDDSGSISEIIAAAQGDDSDDGDDDGDSDSGEYANDSSGDDFGDTDNGWGDDDFSSDDPDQLEDLEKEVKYGQLGSINEGFDTELSDSDLVYLKGAGDDERSLYRKFKRGKHLFNSFETFEGLTNVSKSGVWQGYTAAQSAVGSAVGIPAPVIKAANATMAQIVQSVINFFAGAHNKVSAAAKTIAASGIASAPASAGGATPGYDPTTGALPQTLSDAVTVLSIPANAAYQPTAAQMNAALTIMQSNQGALTPTEAAALSAANSTFEGMSQAQKNMALGENPFQGWYENPDGSWDISHVFESMLGAAAVLLILIAILNSD